MDNLNRENEESKIIQKSGRKITEKIIQVSLVLGLLLGLALIALGAKNINLKDKINKSASLVGSTAADRGSAEDIYSLFICPCCGKPLDKNAPCCLMAEERIAFIDSLIQAGKPENEIILEYAKKYGLNSFVDKNKQTELRTELMKSAPADRPIISISPSSKDLGEVSQKKGAVTSIFDLKNEGKKDLVINKLDTSCGCTSASIVYQGKEGPVFAMAGHGIVNPTNWQIVIPAGETAQLKVYYDPNVHKDLRGPVTREINIFSNDPLDFEKSVTIELNQTD